MIEFNCFQSPIGKLTLAAVKEGVITISFSNKSIEHMQQWYQRYLGMKAVRGNNITQHAKEQVLSYLSGRRQSLDFPVVHLNSPFRKKVLEAERKIPYGETRSYREVAQMVHNSKASRAVGSANAENPLPLFFPCHRIICSDGSLGEFGWGLEVKQWLLNLETR